MIKPFRIPLNLALLLSLTVTMGCTFRPPVTETPPSILSFGLQTFPAGRGAKGIAKGDLNQDGILDLVVTNQDVGTVSILAGAGDGIDVPRQFKQVASLAVGREPRTGIVADLDGDGLLDVAVANFAVPDFGDSTVSILFQQKSQGNVPQFLAPVTIEVGHGPSDLVAADFNQDGVLDLAVASTFSDTIYIVLGQGHGKFAQPRPLRAAEGPQSIDSGDFDKDGRLDLVVANLYSDDITLFLGDGEGGFKPSKPIPPPAFPYRKFALDVLAVDLAAGDLNGDGNLDVAWVNTERPQVELLFGDGAGGLVTSTRLPVGAGPRAVEIADFNGDRLSDIAVLDSYSDEVSVLLSRGGGRFAAHVNFTVGDRPQDLAVGAFNLDSGLDLFVTFDDRVSVLTSGGSPPVINAIGPTQGPLAGGSILLIDGANFLPGATVTIGGTPAVPQLVVPMNRIKVVVPPGAAGLADVVVTTTDGVATAVGAFTYTGGPIPELDLTFTRLIFCNAEAGDSLAGLDTCRLNSTKDSVAGDVDNDGDLDIYAAKTTHHGDHGGSIDPDEVYLNIGSPDSITGTFVDDLGVTRSAILAKGLFRVTSPVVTNDPGNKVQYDIQLADLDDDGDLDVVAMHTDRLRILINNGSGLFVDETSTRVTGLTPNAAFQWDDVDIGDVDNDGDLDVVGASRWTHGGGPAQRPVLLLNDGTANFRANFALLSNAANNAGVDPDYASHDVDFVDIDNDGDLDLVFSGVYDFPATQPRIYLNNLVAGPFNFTLVYPIDPSRFNPAPTGSFVLVAAERPFGPTDAPDLSNKRLRKILDFNGDGFPDIYFGRRNQTDLIYINRGGSETGFFTLLQNVPFASGFTYGASFGDFDLDGRIDIVQADYHGEPMIYLNRITQGTSIDDVNASPLPPFVAIPEPMRVIATGAVGSRRDGLVGGSYWQAVTTDTAGGLDEPDGNKDTGLAPTSKTGFLGTFPQVLDVDVGDFDADGDLDIIFSLGDHQERANRIYLNNTPQAFAFEYAAKIICGVQKNPKDLRVSRGFYATAINIHNPNPSAIKFFKKLALTFPPEEQRPGKVIRIGEDKLESDQALEVDCMDIQRKLFPNGFLPPGYIKGFVVVQSKRSLDVTAVYTTTALDANNQPAAHSSIDVEQIAERGLGVDLQIEKRAEVFPFSFGDQLTIFAVLYTLDIRNIGPAVATDVRVADTLALTAANAIGVVVVLETPIDLPPGGQIENIIQISPVETSFDLALGDIAAGTTRTARFWALAPVYVIGSPPNVVLTDTATVAGAEAEVLPTDNSVIVETQLLP